MDNSQTGNAPSRLSAGNRAGRFAGGRGRLETGQRADIVLIHMLKGAKKPGIKGVWLAGRQMVET